MNLKEKYDYTKAKFIISTYINGFKVYFHKSEIGYTMGQDKELATVLDNIADAGLFINELYHNYSREYHYKIEIK